MAAPAKELSHDGLRVAAGFLTTKELAASSIACHGWREVLTGNHLWAAAVVRDFGSTAVHSDAAVAHQRHALIAQLCANAKVPWSFFRRANALFATLERVARERAFPGLLARLRPGASPESIDAAEAEAGGHTFPPALRAVLLVHDGHDYGRGESGVPRLVSPPHDVRPTFLGHYHFYSTLVSPFLLPAAGVARVTASNGGPGGLDPRYIVVTMNVWGAGGNIVLDSTTGDVYAVCAGLRLVRACPASSSLSSSPSAGSTAAGAAGQGTAEAGNGSSVAAAAAGGSAGGDASASTSTTSTTGATLSSSEPGDGFLRWLEMLVHRIDSGVYNIGPLDGQVARAIKGSAEEDEDEDEVEDAERQGGHASEQGQAGPDNTGSPAITDGPLMAVSLFPEPSPAAENLASRACTRGVCVEMGCVFVPHMTYPGPGLSTDGRTGLPPVSGVKSIVPVTVSDPKQALIGRYHFGYRARLWYDEDQAQYSSVQLTNRYWRIEDGSGKVEQVQGPGVVGEHPLLEATAWGKRAAGGAGGVAATSSVGTLGSTGSAGSTASAGGSSPAAASAAAEPTPRPFEYCSASGSVVPRGGRMGGHFTFAPGTMDAPIAAPFEAAVEPWELRVPAYVYG